LDNSNEKKTIVICSNYAWTIYNFRLPLIKTLMQEGYRVEVLTQFDGHEKSFIDIVHKAHNLRLSRKGINPFTDIYTFVNILVVLSKIKPTAFFSFTIKPVIYGSLACRFLRIPSIATITGLGTAFIKDNWITKIVKLLYKISLRNIALVFFQNSADKDLFLKYSLVQSKNACLIPGSGVDIKKFTGSIPNKRDHVKFILIARMLWDKGIGEFVDAARIVKKNYPNSNFLLLGPLEVENRSSISRDQVYKWVDSGLVSYLGNASDVRPHINNACCIVLPSYREGLSRVLLEASSMSRPLIASNVPGCQELIEHSINGFLCKPKDAYDLASQMVNFINLDYQKKCIMGDNSRLNVVKKYTTNIVCEEYIKALLKLDHQK